MPAQKWLRREPRRLTQMLTALTLAAGAVMFNLAAVPAQADTIVYGDLGYPWPNAPCEFGSAGGASCTNPTNSQDAYDWFESPNGQFSGGDCGTSSASSECFDPRGYEYRNCTSYVAWQLSQYGVPPTDITSLGNGGNWYSAARQKGLSVGTTPKPDAAVIVPGDPGHVAFVSSVNSDGTITVKEYNHDAAGDGDTWTGPPSDRGFTDYVYFGNYMADPPGGSSNPTPPSQAAGPAIGINPANGLATVVAEGPKNSLYAYWQNGNGTWGGPTGIDGGDPNIAYSAPAIGINPATGLATVVAEGPKNSLYAYWQNGNGTWGGPTGIDHGNPNIAYSAPAIGIQPANGLATVVAEGPKNSLYAYWQNGNGTWGGPTGIDGGRGGIAY